MAAENHYKVAVNWKRPFFTIWVGQIFSLLGSSLVQFALVWYLTASTGSAVVLATATFVALLPEVFLGPFAGALVDRWNRRRVMIAADLGIALATVGLALLFWGGMIQTWHIYVVLFIRSLGGAFHYPAMAASTSLMVPEKHLARVAGMNQTLRGVMGIVSPALGAFLLGVLPMYGILAIDVVTAIIAILPLVITAIPQPMRADGEKVVTPRQVLLDVKEGLQFVLTWPGLLGILILAVVLNFLFAPAGTLMPLLVSKHFGGGPFHLGLMEALFGVGIIIGGVALSIWGGFKRKIITSLSGIAGMGVGAILTGLAPANLFVLAVVGMAVTGMMNPLANGPLQAILQSRVPPEKQGRVFTLVGSFAMAMMPLSMVVAAPVAELLGIQVWYILAGGMCVLLALGAMLIKPIINIENDRPPITMEVEAEPLPGSESEPVLIAVE